MDYFYRIFTSKRSRYLALFILLLSGILYSTSWRLRDKLLEFSYDWNHKNPGVNELASIDQVFSGLETISFKELDPDYLDYTKYNQAPYQKLIKGKTFFKVRREQLNQCVVSRFRIKNFMCKDKFYRECVLGYRGYIYVLLDKRVIYKTLELINALYGEGFNGVAFKVRNGHRHPTYNEQVGGAKLSRHIKGEAVDINVLDIDNNGQIDTKDKKIVLDLLDKKIIGDLGGIGLYPGTQSVHFDVRGTRARWNSY